MENNAAIFGFADAVLDTAFKQEEFLPFELFPTQFKEITFDGWKFLLEVSDASFNQLLSICVVTLKEVKRLYEKKFIFTHPELYVEGNGRVRLRIGMMEKEMYKEWLKKKENVKS